MNNRHNQSQRSRDGAGRALIAWFSREARSLPWRQHASSPYAVWIAETMLQQTQVATVIPRYERWLRRFPTVESLADADLDEVLRYWQGLGYYSRARRLHAAARVVMLRYNGVVPENLSDLLQLPGVGPYTAAAIACIAYGRTVPALDVNATRVLSRLSGLGPREKAALAQVWREMAADQPPGLFAQALMDLGSTICRPVSAQCCACPVERWCSAVESGNVGPPERTRPKVVRVRHVGLVLVRGDSVLARRCPEGGLWAGLWEFPRVVLRDGEDPTSAALKMATEFIGLGAWTLLPLPAIHHTVTRFSVTLYGYAYADTRDPVYFNGKCDGLQWVPWGEALLLPMASPQVRLRRLATEILGRSDCEQAMAQAPDGRIADVVGPGPCAIVPGTETVRD